MRRPDAFNSFKSEDMTSPSQSLNIGVDPQLNHMMKIINSPANRKLPVAMGKTFGVPLAELVARQAGQPVIPACVKRICEYIENNGIQREGIFRVSGNSKTVENLKTLFDQRGDANLEETGDVMASAALLKLFFRELPEAVIPDKLNASFVQVLEENSHDADECICQLKQLVEQLPEEHFNTLRYLMAFLVRVADSEEHNRMSSSALGIVFGPSLFRVCEDLDGLRRQTITNQIVAKFIKHFSAIFEADSEVPVTNVDTIKVKESTPPVDMKGSGIRLNDVGSLDTEIEELYKSDSSQPSSPSQNDTTPTDFDDSSDQGSTATSLDSDSEISTPESEMSPAVSDVATEFVELTISSTVTERLFGSETLESLKDCPKASSQQASGRLNEHPAVVTEEKDASHSGQLNCQGPTLASASNNPSPLIVVAKESDHTSVVSAPCMNLVPKETSFHHHQVGHMPAGHLSSEHSPNLAPPATPDVKRREWSFKFDDDYHEIKRSLERSQVFQRSPMSKGRRIRKSVRKSYSLDDLKDDNDYTDEDSLKENEDHDQEQCHQSRQQQHQQQHKSSGAHRKSAKDVGTSHSLDVDPDRPSHPFLELHPQQPQAKEWNSESLSQSPSPNASRKPFVPPLDLTILHEHCDGNEPIPMNHLRASWPMARPDREDDHVMVSPRTSQLKKKGSASSDPNIPPSPPVEQDAFHKMNIREDEATALSIKQLNKRIYSMKRKIKHFEEKFEDEYGYRPSHSEKMARSEIKKYMTELSKARKDLKQMKEDALQAGLMHLTGGGRSTDTSQLPSGTSSGPDEMAPQEANSDEQSAMEELLGEMLQQLSEKRRLAKRPENLKDMDTDQVHEEKVAIQKSLLQFESTFGRPTTKPEKELMRPIYDRYRSVKRMLSKLASPLAKDPGTELQPILEHEAMDFVQASPLHRPGGNEEDSTDEPCDHSVSDRDIQADVPDLKKVKKSHNACNLHELTLPELLEQQRGVKEEKKRLRRVLREFEGEFQRQTGRRVQREDRTPLEAIYGEYKQVKAKLRLLEALLSKHDCHYTI